MNKSFLLNLVKNSCAIATLVVNNQRLKAISNYKVEPIHVYFEHFKIDNYTILIWLLLIL